MRNFNSVSEFCNAVKGGTFGVSMVAVTIPSMNKGGRGGTPINPYYGRVHKCTYTANIALGYDYKSYIEAKLREKKINKEYKEENMNGMHWYRTHYILQGDKDPNQFYLRCTWRPNTTTKVVYLLDGKPCLDAEELAKIKSVIRPSKPCKKQEDYGLTEEEQVVVRNYKIEGVVCMAQGDKVFNSANNININIARQFFKECEKELK